MSSLSSYLEQGRLGAKRRIAASSVVAFGLVLGGATSSSAANVLDNGEFPNNTTPWSATFSILWSNYDHANGTSTGSARFTQPASFVASAMFSEGSAISGGQQVSAGGYFRTVAAAPSGATVEVAIRFFSASPAFNSSKNRFECPSTSWISSAKSPKNSISTNWGTTSVSTTAPSTAKCAQIQISGVDNTTPSDGFDLLSDGIYLNAGPEQLPSAIFSSRFESGNYNDWSNF